MMHLRPDDIRRPLTIDDLEEIEEGDFGWCIYEPPSREGQIRLVYYDDDEFWCSIGLDKNDEDHECGDDPGGKCFLESSAYIYPTADITADFDAVPHAALYRIPESRMPDANDRSTWRGAPGWIYAVALMPDLDMRRLKVGFTARSIEKRMAQFRTANPTALPIGLWPGSRADERAAHDALTGRIGQSEVFQVDDLEVAFLAIGQAIPGRRP